jgi:hypothetical protein
MLKARKCRKLGRRGVCARAKMVCSIPRAAGGVGCRPCIWYRLAASGCRFGNNIPVMLRIIRQGIYNWLFNLRDGCQLNYDTVTMVRRGHHLACEHRPDIKFRGWRRLRTTSRWGLQGWLQILETSGRLIGKQASALAHPPLACSLRQELPKLRSEQQDAPCTLQQTRMAHLASTCNMQCAQASRYVPTDMAVYTPLRITRNLDVRRSFARSLSSGAVGA